MFHQKTAQKPKNLFINYKLSFNSEIPFTILIRLPATCNNFVFSYFYYVFWLSIDQFY